MKKALLIGMFLVTALWMTACNSAAEPPAAPDPSAEDRHPEPQAQTQTLEKFTSVEIEVLAADLRIVPGEQWAVSCQLSEQEPLRRFGVEGDTLYVETKFDPKQHIDRTQDWFVTVTVPEDAALSEVELETISGNVAVQGLSCDSASLSSTSGQIDADSVVAREMDLESASGSINAANLSAHSLDVETVSGGVRVDGAFGELETETVSGNTEVSGAISAEGSLNSTSGRIGLSLSHAASIRASSVGPITLNGERADGALTPEGGVPVTIRSVSGEIVVQTGA